MHEKVKLWACMRLFIIKKSDYDVVFVEACKWRSTVWMKDAVFCWLCFRSETVLFVISTYQSLRRSQTRATKRVLSASVGHGVIQKKPRYQGCASYKPRQGCV